MATNQQKAKHNTTGIEIINNEGTIHNKSFTMEWATGRLETSRTTETEELTRS
jgi:hypothetical protein